MTPCSCLGFTILFLFFTSLDSDGGSWCLLVSVGKGQYNLRVVSLVFFPILFLTAKNFETTRVWILSSRWPGGPVLNRIKSNSFKISWPNIQNWEQVESLLLVHNFRQVKDLRCPHFVLFFVYKLRVLLDFRLVSSEMHSILLKSWFVYSTVISFIPSCLSWEQKPNLRISN